MAGRRLIRDVETHVRLRGLFAVVCLLGCGAAGAQTSGAPPEPQPTPSTRPAVNVDALPLSLERIAEALDRPPALQVEATRPIFRVHIIGQRQRWLGDFDWLGTADGRRPPVGVPWHDQFLSMVTPQQAQSFGAFEGTDLLQVMATSLAQGLAIETVVGAIKTAIRERREREAKAEVDAAIAAWKREREAAAARDQETLSPSPEGGSLPDVVPPR